MLLIIGGNAGRGKALSMELTKRSIYSAYLSYEEIIEELEHPRKRSARSLKRMNATSWDYYMELYRQDTESEEPPQEPLVEIPASVLLLSDIGELKAETVLLTLNNRSPKVRVYTLCEDPSFYAPYMNGCHTIFASVGDYDSIATELEAQFLAEGQDISAVRYGRLCLYSDERDAYLYGKRLYLTPCEYHILRFLTFHRGKPFNADSIMAYCFPSTFARKPTNAITHICRINQKARKVTGEKIILSKRALGYYVLQK